MSVNVSRGVACNIGSNSATVTVIVYHFMETLPFSYTVTINNGSGTEVYRKTYTFTTTEGATDTITLPGGTYTMYGNDGSVVNDFVVDCVPLVCDIAISSVDVTQDINGAGTGTATIHASTTKTGLEYSIDGTVWTSSNYFAGLSAGNKTAMARDSGVCYATKSFVVNNGACTISIATINNTHETAVGANNGTVTSTIAGNIGEVTYSLNDVTYQSSPSFANLSPGNYTYYVKDSVGCKSTTAFTVYAFEIAQSEFDPVPADYLSDDRFTISYQPQLKSWTSFHSYHPNHYVSRGNKLYLTINENNSVWELGTGQKGVYFDNPPEKFKIKFVVNVSPSSTKKFDTMVLYTSSKNGKMEQLFDTFNTITCYTSHQHTGDVELVIGRQAPISLTERQFRTRAEVISNEFRISIPRDLVFNGNLSIFDSVNWVRDSAFDSTPEVRKWRNQLTDKFMVVELEYDNLNDFELDLHSVKTLFRISPR